MAKSVLSLPPDPEWRARVQKASTRGDWSLTEAADLDAAIQALTSQSFDILIADSTHALDARYDLMGAARRGSPGIVLFILCGADIEGHFLTMVENETDAMIARSSDMAPERLAFLFECALDPTRGVGLDKHLPKGAGVYRETVCSLEEKMRAVETVCRQVAARGRRWPSIFDVRLVLEELINNSLMHAFSNETSSADKPALAIEPLKEGQEVEVFYSVGPRWVGMSVRDNQGGLRKREVLKRFYRQMSLSGLTDESGRGLYLSRALANRLILCMAPGKVTEVNAVFDQPASSGEKTVCLFDSAESEELKRENDATQSVARPDSA